LNFTTYFEFQITDGSKKIWGRGVVSYLYAGIFGFEDATNIGLIWIDNDSPLHGAQASTSMTEM